MKTLKLNFRTTLIVSMLALAMFSISSCQSGKSNKVTPDESVEKAIKAPTMDIHTAAFMGNLPVIKQHIQAGSNLNAKDQYGSTPLTIAATFGKSQVAQALIDAKADLSVTSSDGSTPLHTAAFLCRTDIVKMLLAGGANKDVRNNYGSTPYESVTAPFSAVEEIYMQLNRDLGPLGLKLDMAYLKKTRPIVAQLLQ